MDKKKIIILVVTIVVIAAIGYALFKGGLSGGNDVKLKSTDVSESECKDRYQKFIDAQNLGSGSIKKNNSTYKSFVESGMCAKDAVQN
jgi:hypothetical protein